jgi:outer membrane receptor for ferrienterochelin and colicin
MPEWLGLNLGELPHMYLRKNLKTSQLRRTSLAIGLGLCLMGTGVLAQSTTGNIFGQAKAGETVVITGSTGVTRQVTVDESGRYSVTALPLGSYTVTLQRDGETVDSRSNVNLRVGASTEVSFEQNAQTLAAVTVQANALPTIDVTGVDTRTVITAEQLQQLPLARNAESIALLAPGAVPGTDRAGLQGPTGNNLVSFGGASVTENAYYINGMNVTDPLNGLGGINLPYGSIEQLEVINGGYGAAYGRSDGGVINQVGKRGSNEWHFGAQVLYTPDWGRADPDNIKFPAAAGADAGKLRQYRADDKGSITTESAYIGGPLIQDKLFLFASVEAEKDTRQLTSSTGSSATRDHYEYQNPKWYTKLDWNINDSNILELTGASTKHSLSGNTYAYDYDSATQGEFISPDTHTKVASSMWIAKYTGYITDDLTVSAQYGKQVSDRYTQLPDGFDPTLISVIGGASQDPALSGGGGGITNNQLVTTTTDDPEHQVRGANYRFDVTYRLGDHTITAGIDNQRTQDLNDGSYIPTDAGYVWEYQEQTAAPNSDISDGAVGAPGGQGYYVDKYRIGSSASVQVEQRAQYIEDTWQVNDRWLVKVGLRNDQFTNYNSDGQAYIRQTKPQWAPRLGFSWDVNGDSSFKVYGNAGRYYLALPTSVALRGASGSLFTREYYTYTGIDPATGYPTGLTPIDTINGPGVPYSENLEYGQAPDPKSVTATSLTAQYQDEYILGFDKTLNESWAYGAKLTYRSLKNAIDDTCNFELFFDKAQAQGLDTSALRGCYFFNPGRGATFQLPDGNGGYGQLKLSADELGFAHAKRDYYSANLYLEHPFDGKWYGKVDYTYSKSYGNTEGQVKSDIGQNDIAATQDWDYPSLMEYAGGRLSNDRTHVLKAYGTYKVTPEWALSGLLTVASGAPTSCLGLYGPDGTAPAYAGPYYHWCDGVPAPGGTAGDLPWTKTLSLNVEYRPSFADHKLAFNVNVSNVFDEQNPVTLYARDTVNYRLVQGTEAPRYIRFGVSYDY